MGEDEARWSEKGRHPFFDLGGGGAELGEALEVEEEEGPIFDDGSHPACRRAEVEWCPQEASSPTWVQPFLGVEYRQVSTVEGGEGGPCPTRVTPGLWCLCTV